MKRKIFKCNWYKEDTIHLTTKKVATTKTGYRIKRIVIHCTKCNKRTIQNMKQGTYVK